MDWARNQCSIAEAGLVANKHFLYHGGCKIWPLGVYSLSRQRCQRSRSNCRYKEMHHQIHRRPEQNATDWIYSPATQKRILAKSKPSLRTSPPQECVLKVVQEYGNKNYSQLTPRKDQNTPKYFKAVVLQSGALFAWIEEANQNPQILSGIIENLEIRKVGLQDACLDWWKANWWNKYQQERSRRTWKDEVWKF